MDSQSSAKTNATEAWSQLLYSIISDNPPPGMSRAYYYARPVPIRIIQVQLMRFGIESYHLEAENAQPVTTINLFTLPPNRNKYHQEIRHLEDRKEFTKFSEKLQANKDRYQQWTEHIQYFMRINENLSEQRFEHFKYLIWRIRNVMTSILDVEKVQVDNDKYQQGIEHIRSVSRSSVVHVDDKVVTDEDKYQQGIEHIQSVTRSNGVRVDDQVMQAHEDKYQQGIEHIQSVTRSNGVPVDDQVVQADEDKYQQGIEHIQSVMRSNGVHVDYQVVQADEDKYQQGIAHIQSVMGSNVDDKLVRENEDKYQQRMEHIRSLMGATADEEVVQAFEAENQDEIEHEREVLSSLLAFLEFVEDRIWEEHLTLRSEVLEAYELMHQNGVADTIRSLIEGKDPKIQYQEKRLELLLRICDQEICLGFNNNGLQQVIGDVYCKHCEMSQTNEDGNHQLGIKQAKEISNLFDDLLELVENGDMHGEEKPAVQVKVLKLIKILHHYGVDTIRNAVEKELEDVKQKYDDTVQDPSIQYKKKGLEVMLRICGNESYERTINEIVREAELDYDRCNFKITYSMSCAGL